MSILNKRNIKVILLLLCLALSMIIFASMSFTQTKASDGAFETDVTVVEDFYGFKDALIETAQNDTSHLKQTQVKSLAKASEEQEDLSIFALKRLIVIGQVENTYGASSVIKGYKDYNILSYDTVEMTKYAYDQLSKDPSLIVVVDREISIAQTSADEDSLISINATSIPYYNWGYDAVDTDSMTQFLTNNSTSSDIVVVVIDSGINTSHMFFTDRLITKADGRFEGSSFEQTTAQNATYGFEDDNGHGSHVSGIITEMTPDNVKILPIKVLSDEGTGSILSLTSALEEIIEDYSQKYNIASVNLSLGVQRYASEYQLFNILFKQIYDLNIIPVVSAGNDQLDTENYMPASNDHVITVSALTENSGVYQFDTRYSNFGDEVDISAPGTDILSAFIGGTNSGAYASGTSMASPFVSGAVALLCLDDSYWMGTTPSYTSQVIEERLLENAIDLGDAGWDKYYGYGMVNFSYIAVEDKNIDMLELYQNQSQITSEVIEFGDSIDFSIALKEPYSSNNLASYDIRYTTDESIPTTNSLPYSSSIEITTSQTLNIIGYEKDDTDIAAVSKIYTIDFFDSTESEESFFEIDENGQITKYTGHFVNLEIPTIIDGITVRSIGDYVFAGCEFESVTIPSSCTKIGKYSFSNCIQLVQIDLGGVTEIDAFAFENCIALSTIDLNNVKILGQKLEDIPINGHVFEGCVNLNHVYLSSLESAGDAIFDNSGVEYIVLGRIFGSYHQIPFASDIVIYGYSSTGAQLYASSNGNTFIPLDEFALQTDLEDAITTELYSDYSLSVSATGFNIEYQWYSTDSTTDNGQMIYGQTFSIIKVDTSNEGTTGYFVRMKNWDGSMLTSSICFVTVEDGTLYTLTYVIDETRSQKQEYHKGEQIDLIADPTREGYDFAGWYEDEQCTIAFESTVMPEGHLTIYAKWTIQTFTIFTSTTAGGWISPSGQSIVEWGDSLAITVGVETGYQLESVIIDNTPLNETQLSSILSEGLLLLNIRENHDISFTFGKKLYTITYILDNNNYNVASYYYQAQTTAPKSPTFEYYEYFDGWYSDDNYTTQHEFGLMPADDLTLYGRSLDVEYNIYAQVQGKSQISPSSQILTYPEDATFSIDLAVGYEIADVIIDGKQVTEEELEEIKASLSIPFSIEKYAYRSQNKQSEDHTIVLHVSPLTYNITFDINYSDEEQSYQFDTDQTIQLPPAPQRRGYTFEGWYTEEECVNQFTLTTMPAQDVKLFAKWSIIVYTINTKTNEGGQITPSGNSGVEFGNSITYNFNPNVGYHVESICVDGVYLNNQSLSQAVLYGLTIDNVEENHSIDVKFGINTYKVLVSVYGDGDFISNSEDSVFEYGDTVQFSTTTNLGNYYMDVYVNNNLVETDHGMLTIDNIDQDMTIVVRFTKKPFFKTVDGLVTIILLLTVVFVMVISAITTIFRRKNLYRNMDRY